MQHISTALKNKVLRDTAEQVELHRDAIIKANEHDIAAADNLDSALADRLIVDHKKIDAMIQALSDVSASDDPVGKVLYHYTQPNGLSIENRTCPFGNILIIYESRPDVTIEAAAIAFKSGNSIVLKGGKEALHTNLILHECWQRALKTNNLDSSIISYLNINRQETQQLLKEASVKFDLIVPRGGDTLINFVKEYATCPVIVSGRGNNFLYVHKDADPEMALNIILNAKTSKISACNALDKILIDAALPEGTLFITKLLKALKDAGVEVRSYDNEKFPDTITALPDDRDTEYLDYIILLEMVSNGDEAVRLINKYSGHHSAVIITKDKRVAGEFMQQVDAAAVYHNASSRFTDGGMFGLGAELAISTDKLHHRGPLGTVHLVSNKWYINGNGQIR